MGRCQVEENKKLEGGWHKKLGPENLVHTHHGASAVCGLVLLEVTICRTSTRQALLWWQGRVETENIVQDSEESSEEVVVNMDVGQG